MLTKAERDEARAFCTDARARWITWNEADRISRIAVKALDDLDAQDRELGELRTGLTGRIDECPNCANPPHAGECRRATRSEVIYSRMHSDESWRRKVKALCEAVAWAYQLAGAAGMAADTLDALSALAAGKTVAYQWPAVPPLFVDSQTRTELEAEVARLTAENDRLIVIAKADEWQARYWAEHDAVADREATIMAERAQSAAMRQKASALAEAMETCHVCHGAVIVEDGPTYCEHCSSDCDSHAEPECVGLDVLHLELQLLLQLPDAGAKLLADRAAELAAYRKALEPFHDSRRVLDTIKASDSDPVYVIQGNSQWLVSFAGILRKAADALESSGAGKALLDAHAAELARQEHKYKLLDVSWGELKAENISLRQREIAHAAEIQKGAREWLHLDAARTMLIEERDALRQRAEAAETRAPCDGSAERSHIESTKAAIAALWETNPEIAYESPAQVICETEPSGSED